MGHSDLAKLRDYIGLVEQADTLVDKLGEVAKQLSSLDPVGTINNDLVDKALVALGNIPVDNGAIAPPPHNLPGIEPLVEPLVEETETPVASTQSDKSLKKHGIYIRKLNDCGWDIDESGRNGPTCYRVDNPRIRISADSWANTSDVLRNYLKSRGGAVPTKEIRDHIDGLGHTDPNIIKWHRASLMLPYINAKGITAGYQGKRWVVLKGNEHKVPSRSGREPTSEVARETGKLAGKRSGEVRRSNGKLKNEVDTHPVPKTIHLKKQEQEILDVVNQKNAVSTASLMVYVNVGFDRAQELLQRMARMGVLDKKKRNGVTLYTPASNVVVASV